MPKKLKLERDNMDRKIVTQTIGELHEEAEETENLGQKYVRDQETLNRLMKSIEESTLPEEVKQEQRDTLNESKRILYNYYKKEVEEEKERQNEELRELLEMAEDTAKEVAEQTEAMEEAHMETGNANLEENIAKQKEYFEFLEKIKTDEAKELKLRQEQAEIMRRFMQKNKGKSL